MLLLLQVRQRMTASELASELGVSVRTILRDVTALMDADVPIFIERGRYGGIVLLPGSRLDVSSLTPTEIEALKLLGLDQKQALQLGVDEPTRTAARKLATRVSPKPSPALGLSDLIIVDNKAWFSSDVDVANVADLARDLQSGRRLNVLYRSSAVRNHSWETVDPYGLLAKAGKWYLVADVSGKPKLYALQRLKSWEALTEDRKLRSGASLSSVSQGLREALESRHGVTVTAILTSNRLDMARRILGSRLTSNRPIDDDNVEITLSYDTLHAVRQLLQFGDSLFVTGPPQAQVVMGDLVTAMAAQYEHCLLDEEALVWSK